MFNCVNQVSFMKGVPQMPHGKPLIESSLTKVVIMCHCPIEKVFHKVAFHMTLHDWFSFVRVRSATCEVPFTKITFLGFWCMLAL